MAMNRKDAPQMTPMAEKIVQSDQENAAAVVVGAGADGAAVTSHLYRGRSADPPPSGARWEQ